MYYNCIKPWGKLCFICCVLFPTLQYLLGMPYIVYTCMLYISSMMKPQLPCVYPVTIPECLYLSIYCIGNRLGFYFFWGGAFVFFFFFFFGGGGCIFF